MGNFTPEGLIFWYISLLLQFPCPSEMWGALMPQAHPYPCAYIQPSHALPHSACLLCSPSAHAGSLSWLGRTCKVSAQFQEKIRDNRARVTGNGLSQRKAAISPDPALGGPCLKTCLYALHISPCTGYYKANGMRVPHFQKTIFSFTADWMRWVLTFYAHVMIGLRSKNAISSPWLWMLIWFIAKH